MSKIHPSAIIDKKAQLAADVAIGPFSIIGPDVKIGAGTVIANNVLIEGLTEIGEKNFIGAGSIIGGPAQVKHCKTIKKAALKIGDENTIRELVTINSASIDSGVTLIGDRNFIMINCHVGHDCVLENDITMANLTTLGGHVHVEDKVVMGGLSGIHQHVKIGRLAMVAGFARVILDVPPYSMCAGHPARICGINSVGLKRAGYSSQQSMSIRRAIRMLFRSSGSFAEAIERVQTEYDGNPDIRHLLAFVKASKRGMAREKASVREEG